MVTAASWTAAGREPPPAVGASQGSSTAPASLELVYHAAAANQPARVELKGLPAPALEALAEARLDPSQWYRVLAVHVVNGGVAADLPVLGSHALRADSVVFEPRFAFQPGLQYLAVFRAAGLPDGADNLPAIVRLPVSLPRPATAPTQVEAVYPSADILPENLLKFYLQFSGPMSRGDSYRHIRVLDDEGRPVEAPFLNLPQELWNRQGTRLTLLFDPGRIKRGLKPREDVGPSLREGRSYTLVIQSSWEDAHGKPLLRTHRKPFRVIAPDTIQPNPQRWRITAPAAGSRNALVVRFSEPLDHGLLQHTLQVVDPRGAILEGEIETVARETVWHFRPTTSWTPGPHLLIAGAALEDLAGNSVGRPFEVPLDGLLMTGNAEGVALSFEVSGEHDSE
jgi:hypothetical protein